MLYYSLIYVCYIYITAAKYCNDIPVYTQNIYIWIYRYLYKFIISCINKCVPENK